MIQEDNLDRDSDQLHKKEGKKQAYACMLNSFNCVQLFVTLDNVAYQTPLSMEISPGKNTGDIPSLGNFPNPSIEPGSILQADSLWSEPQQKDNILPRKVTDNFWGLAC